MAKSQAELIKIGIIIAAFVVAGVLLLANFTSIFDKPAKAPERTTEQQKEMDRHYEEAEKIQKEMEESGEIQIGGA